MHDHLISLVVPRQHIKLVKSALEVKSHLNRHSKIHPVSEPPYSGPGSIGKCIIPTTFSTNEFPDIEITTGTSQKSIIHEILTTLNLNDATTLNAEEISLLTSNVSETRTPSKLTTPRYPVLAALETWLHQLPPDLLHSLSLTPESLLSAFPSTYTLYPPLLLLPAHAFQSPVWQTLLSTLRSDSRAHPHHLENLYASLVAAVACTHLAINAPIPPTAAAAENILRRPTALTPLHGAFGPPPTTSLQTTPSSADLSAAFWATARQNGIVQTWAPLYTMFSRGNVREKARVLALPSVASAVEEGEKMGGGCAAVDMYAGIGYFAFSYRRAGVRCVVCWELNPWSVEGLRRGAGENGWGCVVVEGGAGAEGAAGGGVQEDVEMGKPDFLVFQESNEFAGDRIEGMRGALPPVRHVNCGLLPTSDGSWGNAVRVLDPGLGGWMHLHENVDVREIGVRAEVITADIGLIAEAQGREKVDVRLEHVERVKTYAPGVMHVVLDIWVGPLTREVME